jgi:hypothetical protein
MRASEFTIENAGDNGMAEAKRKKKSSRSMGGYFFPGYGYYGGGDSGEGGGDGGGGESNNRGMAEDEIDEVLGFTISRDKQPKKPAPSLATMRKEFEKDKSGQIEKPAQGRGAPAVVKYVRRTTDEDASWGMAPESQGHKQ